MKILYEKFLDFKDGKSLVRAHIAVDTSAELPEPDGIENKILEAGSKASVINEGKDYMLSESGEWYERGVVNFSSAADLEAAVRSGAAAKLCHVGDLIAVERTTSDGETKAFKWEVIGIGADGEGTLTLQLYRLWDELLTMGREALIYCPEGLSPGNYSIGLPSYTRSCMIPSSPERVYFNLSVTIPAGGQLVPANGSLAHLEAYSSPDPADIIRSSITLLAEPVDGVTYTDLGTADGSSATVNHISHALYGSPYPYSELRRWIASDKPAAQRTWTAQNVFSRKPAALSDGFLYGWESWFSAMLKAVEKTTYVARTDSVQEVDGEGYRLTLDAVTTADKAFLPSALELGGRLGYSVLQGDLDPEGMKYKLFDSVPVARLREQDKAFYSQWTRSQDWLTDCNLYTSADVRFGKAIKTCAVAPIVVLGAANEALTGEINYTPAADNLALRIVESQKADYNARMVVWAVVSSMYSSRGSEHLEYRNIAKWYRDGYITRDIVYALRELGKITPAQYAYITGDHSHDGELTEDITFFDYATGEWIPVVYDPETGTYH